MTVILQFQEAVAAKSFHLPSEEISQGNVSEALKTAQHVLEGGIHIGGQEHFYLETQACLVVPKGEDGEMEVFSSTQHPASIQVYIQAYISDLTWRSLDLKQVIGMANSRRQEAYISGSSVRLCVVRAHLFRVMRYRCRPTFHFHTVT